MLQTNATPTPATIVGAQTTTVAVAPASAATAAKPDTAAAVAPVRKVFVLPRQQGLSSADSTFFALNADSTADLNTVSHSRIAYDLKPSEYSGTAPADTVFACLHATQTPPSQPVLPQPRGTTPLGSDIGWLMPVALVIIIGVGIMRMLAGGFLGQVMTLIVSGYHWKNVMDTMSFQKYRVNMSMHLTSLFVLPLMLYELAVANDLAGSQSEAGLMLYAKIICLSVLFVAFKLVLHRTIGFAFDIADVSAYIIRCKLLALDICALLVLPIVIFFPFAPESTYKILSIIAISVIVFMYLWRFVKSVKIISGNFVSLSYFILYLCTVEAVPWICIYKFMTATVG